jgi:hypothetical protein
MTNKFRSICFCAAITFVTTFIALLPLRLLAEDQQITKDPHHKGLLSSINLGVRYSSILENRGVVLYRDFQIDPVAGIFLFDDRLEFLGDSVSYRDFVYKDRVRLRTRIVSISDKPLFPAYESVKSSDPDRPDTYEWNSRAEVFLPGYNDKYKAELDFGYAKDISAHHGNYVDLAGKIELFRFRLPVVGSLLEPGFHASMGWGDSAHNRYFYGPTADQASLNNLAYGLWVAFPEEADRYFPVIQLTHFEVLGNSNRAASYAQNRGEGWLFSFIATVGVLE